MIKKILLMALYVAAFTACKKDGQSMQDDSLKDDAAFLRYEDHFLEELLNLSQEKIIILQQNL